MPSPVPAGFTRGPIMFVGSIQTPQAESRLMQRFWDEAGSYGARIVIVATTDAESQASAKRLADLFRTWECDSVTGLSIESRKSGFEPSLAEQVQAATGVLLLGANSLRLASTLGGTPLAQALRRANAQSKVICGLGESASVLCQHMIAFDTRAQTPLPFLHRHLIQFAPGLGIVNRVVLDGGGDAGIPMQTHLSRLLTAVAYNPFLVGVSLDADTGAVIYPDTTMDIFGLNNALVVDGSQLIHTNLHEVEPGRPLSVLGVQLHVLAQGYTFHFDSRTVNLPAHPDDALARDAVKAAF